MGVQSDLKMFESTAMGETSETDDIINPFDDTSKTQGESEGETEVDLFRLSQDEFVNDGAIALTRRLSSALDKQGKTLPIRIESERVVLECDPDVEDLIHIYDTLFETIREGLSRTHQRAAMAYQINRALSESGRGPEDHYWIPAPNRPFPTKPERTFAPFYPEPLGVDGMTNYDYDQVSYDALADETVPIDPTDVGMSEGDDEVTLIKERTTYSGNRNSWQMELLSPEIAAYIAAYTAAVARASSAKSGSESDANSDGNRGVELIEKAGIEVEIDPAGDKPCACCGSSIMPTGKIDSEHWDGQIRYNQTSTPWAANDGSPKALGQKAAGSDHQGRCVGCVIAGIYHGLRGKPVFEIDASEQTKRVLTPVGEFKRLNAIHALMENRVTVDDRMDPQADLRATVGGVQSDSAGFQVLGFFDAMLQDLSERVGDDPRTMDIGARIPTGVRSYVAGKNPNGGREISSFDLVKPGSWVYELLSFRSVSSETASTNAEHNEDGVTADNEAWPYEPHGVNAGTEGYWPMDVIRWYGSVDLSREKSLEHRKNQLASGLMNRNPDDVVTAIAEVYKRTVADDDPYMERFEVTELHHYFDTMINHMLSEQTDDPLDDETRQGIFRLGRTIGNAFARPEYIGNLTRLQNARTRDAFEDALARVGEALHKRRLEIEAERRKTADNGSSDNDDTDIDDFWSDYDSTDLDRVFDAVITGNWRSVQRLLVAHAFMSAQYDYVISQSKQRNNDAVNTDNSNSGSGSSIGSDGESSTASGGDQ